MFTRYSIYYTPEAGTSLADFGAEWLGWDSAAGVFSPHRTADDLDVAAITETPRKYGFHGTIKPPFRLAQGHTEDALQDGLAILCAQSAPVVLAGLELARLGRFFALVPTDAATALRALAAQVVQELDIFRGPPSDAELAKRRAQHLSPAQDAYLLRWGYPYVLDQFRFHMTLSGRLDKATAQRTEAALAPMLAPLDLAPYTINGLTLLGEDINGRFHQIQRYALTG